jgi:transposase-like protein
MRCLACGSQAVTERSERTAQGYRRFRCRACGKQFNERSDTLLNRTQYPSDVIALGSRRSFAGNAGLGRPI